MRKIGLIGIAAALLLYTLNSCTSMRYAMNSDYPRNYGEYQFRGELKEVFPPSGGDGLSERRMLVYLPEDYADSTKHFPVMYLLHGARGNEMAWIKRGNLLKNIDSLTCCGAMKPTIIVLPNTNSYRDDLDYGKSREKRAMESFFGLDGTVEKHFIDDVVGYMDANFRTIADKEHRAIAGLSLGGTQAVHISATYYDKFDYVGLFSPMIHSPRLPSEDNDFFKRLKRRLELQFEDSPQLYAIMIGRTDIFHPRIGCYHKYLSRKGYEHEYLVSKGGHSWANWEAYSILFMSELWQ